MLSRTWGRARSLLRDLYFRRSADTSTTKQLLLAQYQELSREIADVKHQRGNREFVHPFINERIVKEEKRNVELENIFSLQNLKLLGTKDGYELVKLQHQLQKNLENILSTPSASISSPNQQSTSSSKNINQQIGTDSQDNLSQNNIVHGHNAPHLPQLTLEDKREIEQLANSELPKSAGFLARTFSWIKMPSTSIEDTDVQTLQQLVQEKAAELNALRTQVMSDNNHSNSSNPTNPTNPVTPSPEQQTNSGYNTNNTSNINDTNNSNKTVVIPATLLDQINHRKQLRADGVPADQLPKLDLSGIPPQTLKQIYLANKKLRKPPTPKDDDSNIIK